ncbi:MAG: glucose-1-phosphate thymidylyltransferase [Parcubacteria group bacterium Gr01-1014_72]|nr:MAG: glucose-1-phosphate thymidylyltransferase [Parcubacteria group bacterium Gr01-1014_72]
MKAIIMAGGDGTRLRPLTHAVNKHLLPVYDRPVIYYAVEKVVEAGIDRIMLVTSPEYVGSFVRLLGSGKDFISKRTGSQIQIVYGIQNTASGIAYGLHIAADYIGKESCLLYLGDNIFEDSLAPYVTSFKTGATVFLKKVPDPERFGVATLNKNGRVVAIEEKPEHPKSDLAVLGAYLYDNTVFDTVRDQPLSDRGELEISYVNSKFIEQGTLTAHTLTKRWFDIGTPDALLEAANYMKERKHHAK